MTKRYSGKRNRFGGSFFMPKIATEAKNGLLRRSGVTEPPKHKNAKMGGF